VAEFGKWRRSGLAAAKLEALSPSLVLPITDQKLFRKKTLQTAQEGEKTPNISRLMYHSTLLGYSDQDVI